MQGGEVLPWKAEGLLDILPALPPSDEEARAKHWEQFWK
jgi:hypothetical protein